ncbi:MAG: PilW family protein [Candidatus Aminicenantia bacterium]
MKNQKGMTLIELLVSSIIIVMALIAIFAVYSAFIRQSAKQRFVSESEMEERTALYLLQRDVFMVGFGIPSTIVPITGVNSSTQSDTLILRGTYLTLEKAGESASAVTSATLNSVTVKKLEGRGNIEAGYWVVFVDPFTKQVLSNSNASNFCYKVTAVSDSGSPPDVLRTLTFSQSLDDGSGSPIVSEGTLVYGVTEKNPRTPPSPYYPEITYTLHNADPADRCPPGCMRLARIEDSSNQNTQVILPCVADFQIAYGFMDSQGNIIWENDISPYPPEKISAELKLVRVNLLVPLSREGQYTAPHPRDSEVIEDRTYTFTSTQKKYRWKIIKLELKPRNLL